MCAVSPKALPCLVATTRTVVCFGNFPFCVASSAWQYTTIILTRTVVSYEFSGLLVNPSSSGVYKLGYSDPSTLELP